MAYLVRLLPPLQRVVILPLDQLLTVQTPARSRHRTTRAKPQQRPDMFRRVDDVGWSIDEVYLERDLAFFVF